MKSIFGIGNLALSEPTRSFNFSSKANVLKQQIQWCFFILLLSILLPSCKKGAKDAIPTTLPIISFASGNATSSTTIVVDGAVSAGFPITGQGVWWSAISEDAKHTIPVGGNAALEIEGTIKNLTPHTSYHVGVYATNVAGTSYYEDSQLVQTPAQ